MSHRFRKIFFFNDTATTEIYTLSLHDALPIFPGSDRRISDRSHAEFRGAFRRCERSEEHTSELQSHLNIVCRLLLEKKKHHTCLWQGKVSPPKRLVPPPASLSKGCSCVSPERP